MQEAKEIEMMIDGALAHAARILIQWPRHHVARLAGLGEADLAGFETGATRLDARALERLRKALEEGGAVFIVENGGGPGVRLKFARKDVRAINKWEGEGGPVGDDDI
jgi:hypothetical protein